FHGPNGAVTLVLQQDGANRVTGVMRGADGVEMRLQGEVDAAGRVIGTITIGGDAGWFAAGIVDGRLLMAVAEFDPETGQPDMESGWSLTFERVGGAAGTGGTGGGQPGGQFGAAEDTPLIRQW